MLEIAPEKVAHVIIKAREYDSKVEVAPVVPCLSALGRED